jgi:hypothetical protein
MKQISTMLLAATLIAKAGVASAQVSVGADKIPVVGDRLTTTRMDTSGVEEGTPGGNKVWDFSGLTSVNQSYVIEYIAASATAYADSFPSAQMASLFVDGADTSYTFFSTGSGRLEAHGFAGSVNFLHYDNTELQMITPLQYNDQYTDLFGGVMVSPEDFTLRSSGSLTVKNDAYGTLTLPGGVSSIAARVKFTRVVDDTIYANGLPILTSRTTNVSYEWFTPTAKFPVLQIAYFERIGSGGSGFHMKQVELNTSGTTGVDPGLGNQLAKSFQLDQNYPNPFNPSTVISFRTVADEFVSLKVYNLLGQEVATLVHESMKPGSHSIPFTAAGLPSGTYLYRLQAGNRIETRKMAIVK